MNTGTFNNIGAMWKEGVRKPRIGKSEGEIVNEEQSFKPNMNSLRRIYSRPGWEGSLWDLHHNRGGIQWPYSMLFLGLRDE